MTDVTGVTGGVGVDVCLISTTPTADDPRVRRQGQALAAAGYAVTAVGVGAAVSPAPGFPVVTVTAPPRSLRRRLTTAARIAGSAVGMGTHESRLLRDGVHDALLGAAVASGARLHLANDWSTLPVAAAAARATGGRYAFDAHELALEEHPDSRAWRLLTRPAVREVQARHVPGAAFVTTVSEGIADHLRAEYLLPRRPSVVRNVPVYEAHPFRATGPEVSVLYQGLICRGRNLGALIESTDAWPASHRLVVRGPGSAADLAHYRELARAGGRDARVTIEAAVPPDRMVAEAARHDVGVMPLVGTTAHNRAALPNKLFEYTMAGLALCFGDVPEARAAIETAGNGVVIAGDGNPGAIAEAVSLLTRDRIDECKRRSLAAARDWSWDRESAVLTALVSDVIGPPTSR